MTAANRTLWVAASIGVTALLVLGWQMVANYSGIPPVFLPGPDRAWNALVHGLNGGELLYLTGATVERMIYGWVLASLAGIVIGAVIGSSKIARDYIAPMLEIVRPVPVSAFMPVVMAFLGLNGRMVLIVITIGAVWPVLLATVHGVASVEPRLVEVARSLRFNRLQMLWKFALPNSQPDILAGMRIGLTVALILAVIGEMLTSENGLGWFILTAARAYRSADLFAGVILLGLIGLVSNLALQAIEFVDAALEAPLGGMLLKNIHTGETICDGSIAEFLQFWLTHPVLPEKEQRDFDFYYRSYKKHFGRYLKHWYTRQTEELIALIEAHGRPRILEVGCGCGTETLWAALAGADATGVDITPDLHAVANARLKWLRANTGQQIDCTFILQSVLDIDESAPFDIIYLEQAFHHLEPRADVVAKLTRLVAPGGYIILSEANGWNPLLQASLFKLRGFKTIIHHQGHIWGHERITMPFALMRDFGRDRFLCERLEYFRTLPNLRIADNLLRLERMVPAFVKPAFTHYNITLRKQA